MSEYVDFLIVGGGIAGLSLQYELEKRSKVTALLDSPDRNVSTRIAAGIVNPIAGKFFALTWRADDFFPNLASHYAAMEGVLSKRFYYPRPIYRILPTAGEQNMWLSKAHLPKYSGYCTYEPEPISNAQGEYGALRINYGGHLDTNTYLNSLWIYLSDRAICRKEHFDHSALDLDNRTYKDLRFGQIVFCEGKEVVDNPLFSHCPFSPNKGEGLILKSDDLNENIILVGGVFVLPQGDGVFKVGASYDHFDMTLDPTDKSRNYLLDRLHRMLDVNYEILDQFVGLRPAVKDRRPIMGKHQTHDFVSIFNGLGSKGVSMTPCLVGEMTDHLLEGKPLHPECDINRFD